MVKITKNAPGVSGYVMFSQISFRSYDIQRHFPHKDLDFWRDVEGPDLFPESILVGAICVFYPTGLANPLVEVVPISRFYRVGTRFFKLPISFVLFSRASNRDVENSLRFEGKADGSDF